MAEEQLSVRSTAARVLAHELAKQHGKSVSEVVLEALERLRDASEGMKRAKVEAFWSDFEREAELYREAARQNGGRDFDIGDLYGEDGLPQ
jgi:hypothetical protein